MAFSHTALLPVACMVSLTASAAFALDARHLAVIINTSDPLSVQIGEYYAAQRRISFQNIIPVAFNYGVAQDEDTQSLRREMNKRLLIIIGGFVAFYFFLTLTEQPGEIGA